jgi:hypothetical protein
MRSITKESIGIQLTLFPQEILIGLNRPQVIVKTRKRQHEMLSKDQYALYCRAKGYETGWEQAMRDIKKSKESVIRIIVKDFNTYIDQLRDEIYEKRENHAVKHKTKFD